MGNGASSDGRAGSERPMSRPHSAAAGAPRKKQVLANQGPRRSANSFHSPAATKAHEASRQTAARSAEQKSMALQRVAAQRRAEANPTEEDALRAFTRNADPTSLRVLQLIQQADAVPQSNPSEKLRVLRQCYPLLESVPKERFDQLAVTVYQQEGDIYYQQLDIQNAKDTFSRAITLAEKRVARQDTDMYMVLKRYVLAMIGMARIWYDHERDHQGFKFVDHKHPKVPAVDGNNSDDGNSSLSSIESSLSSDGGSVFSLNEAILRSMAPRPPRRQTGPLFKRLKVKAPHTLPNAQYDREDEFVLHSRMTRELVASPCELLLLRCCEVVQIGHNAQSELLIPPQIELAQIYEDLALYSRALLLVRRCLGILCSVYDYDHPWVIQLMQRADRLQALLDEQLRNEMATKIQATWKMHKAMQALADALGRPVKRHQWIPRKYRTTPDLDYLGDFVGDMPDDQQLGGGDDEEAEEEVPAVDAADPRTWAVVPQTAPVPEVSLSSDRPRRDVSYDGDESEPAAVLPNALVRYAPTQHREGGDTFTAMVPNANVVGTTQDTQTDTDVQHTEFGDVLTVRTTTVTKTITEDLAHSDDDEELEEEEEEDEEEPEYEEEEEEEEPVDKRPAPAPRNVPPPLPPSPAQLRQQPPQPQPQPLKKKKTATHPPPPPPPPHHQQQQKQPPPKRPPHRRPPPPPPAHDSPYPDEDEEEAYPAEPEEEDDYDDDEGPYPPERAEDPYDVEEAEEPPVRSSPRDTSTEPPPHRRPHPPRVPPSPKTDDARRRRDGPPPKSSPPLPPPKPQQRAKQTQVQPRGHAAGTQTRASPPPPPPPQQQRHHRQQVKEASYSDLSVSASTAEEPPRPVVAAHKTKQTQVQPRGHAAATQTRASPAPQEKRASPPPPPAPLQPKMQAQQQQQQQQPQRETPVRAAAPAPPPPRRTTAATQYETASPDGSVSELHRPPPRPPQSQPQPPRREKLRNAPSPYAQDDIPSLVERARPAPVRVDRAVSPTHSEPQTRSPPPPLKEAQPKKAKAAAPPPPPPQQRSPSEEELEEEELEEEEDRYPRQRQASASPVAPPKPYNPEVVHNSKREPFRDLVEPNERYPLDANGAPAFLPPLPYRAGLAPNGTPLPPALNADNGQLVLHDATRNGALQPVNGSRTNGTIQVYDPRKIDVNAQPGMPMTLPSPANGYPRHTQNAPLPPPAPQKKVTRDHKIIKTRIIRTYRRGSTTDSDDDDENGEAETGTNEEEVFEHESGSSWETSGSVSWEASRSGGGSSSRSSSEASSEAAVKKAGTKKSHSAEKKPSSASKMVSRKPKEATSSNGVVARPSNGRSGDNVSPKENAVATLQKSTARDEDAVKPEVVNSSVQHHVTHNRRSKTTTTVRHLDDVSEL